MVNAPKLILSTVNDLNEGEATELAWNLTYALRHRSSSVQIDTQEGTLKLALEVVLNQREICVHLRGNLEDAGRLMLHVEWYRQVLGQSRIIGYTGGAFLPNSAKGHHIATMSHDNATHYKLVVVTDDWYEHQLDGGHPMEESVQPILFVLKNSA